MIVRIGNETGTTIHTAFLGEIDTISFRNRVDCDSLEDDGEINCTMKEKALTILEFDG